MHPPTKKSAFVISLCISPFCRQIRLTPNFKVLSFFRALSSMGEITFLRSAEAEVDRGIFLNNFAQFGG